MMKYNNLLAFLIVLISSNTYCQCFWEGSGSVDNINVYANFGDNHIDEIFRWTNQNLEKIFYVDVKYGFYDDGEYPNAFAYYSDDNNFDGQTYMGINMINEFIDGTPNDYFAAAFIMAHEYGHILQFQRNDFFIDNKLSELQADYLAGYATYLHGMNPGNPKSLLEYIEYGIDIFYDIGDMEFGSANHHGTPQQRSAAYKAGCKLAFGYIEEMSKAGESTALPSQSVIWNKSIQYIEDNY